MVCSEEEDGRVSLIDRAALADGKKEGRVNIISSLRRGSTLVGAIHSKGDVIPTPESESEYDSRPSYTPDSGTGSFALESLEPVPSLVSAQLVG